MNFDFDEFAKEIHTSFKEHFTLDEVKGMLYLDDEGYLKSNPSSPGRHLVLHRIMLKGVKDDGSLIDYDKELHTGVSMWISDNLKGKSTLFKAIKFALTGNGEKLTPLMRKWIKAIQLEFSIGAVNHTVLLDLSSSQLFTTVFDRRLSVFPDAVAVASFKSREAYAAFLQELFFDQLGYYPLRKVQANQASVNLADADFSWATYYSSIYLQSKDYGNLAISAQNDAVFQVLLGLQFTYSIHAIDVKRRKAERELALAEDNLKANATKIDIIELQQSLNAVKTKLKTLKENPQKEVMQTIQKRIATLIEQNAILRKEKSALDDRVYQGGKHISSVESEIESKLEILKQYKREVTKAKRLINENQEYMDSGIFFSNLQVTECPHCEHVISSERVRIEKEQKSCMLCDHEIGDASPDTSLWQERIADLNLEVKRFEEKIDSENQSIGEMQMNLKTYTKGRNQLQMKSDELLPKMENIDIEIRDQELLFQQLVKENAKDYFEEMEELITQRTDLEYKILKYEAQKKADKDSILTIKVQLLKKAHQILLHRRSVLGSEVLKSLEEIMLSQLRALGLTSYTRVWINPENFSIHYYQGATVNTFSDITEGEQLRAKLGLYLSLIELDLQKGLGRHPKLIILDSPSKEEGDEAFVEGLKETLVHIEEKFGDKVQVLVGTANRNLRDAISNPSKLEIRNQGEFLF